MRIFVRQKAPIKGSMTCVERHSCIVELQNHTLIIRIRIWSVVNQKWCFFTVQFFLYETIIFHCLLLLVFQAIFSLFNKNNETFKSSQDFSDHFSILNHDVKHHCDRSLASLQSGEELLTLDGHKPLDRNWLPFRFFFCRWSNHRNIRSAHISPKVSGTQNEATESYSRLFLGVAFPLLMSITYSLWGFLHFRYLKCFVNIVRYLSGGSNHILSW